MKKNTLLLSIMFSILSLYASDNNTLDKNGFTVTYLMLERAHISLPQDQTKDTNCTENRINGGDSDNQ